MGMSLSVTVSLNYRIEPIVAQIANPWEST
jgi:hypothetical protein